MKMCFFNHASHFLKTTNSLLQFSYLNSYIISLSLLLHLAEDYLESVEGTTNYGLLLLQLLTAESASAVIRTAAAVTFKNFIKRNWRVVSLLLISVISNCYTNFMQLKNKVHLTKKYWLFNYDHGQ